MLNLDTTTQLQLLAAAGTAFAAVKRLTPPDPKALAAVGLLTAALAPTLEEFDAWAVQNGQPRPDPAAYTAMLASARGFALTVATSGETQH